VGVQSWVQRTAFIANPSLEVIGGAYNFPGLSASPVIVTNTQWAGKALISRANDDQKTSEQKT